MGKSLEEIEKAFRAQYSQQDTKDSTTDNRKDNTKNAKELSEIQEMRTEIQTQREMNEQEGYAEEVERPRRSLIANLFFYFMLVGVLLSVLLFAGGMLGNKTIGGIRLVNMTTASMVGVYPAGSLLVVKEVPAEELRIGDDITFLKSSALSVTHRIAEVQEDEEAGGHIFITRGVNDPDDEEEVVAAHVLGEVSSNVPQLGTALDWARGNLQYIVLGFIVSVIGAFAIKLLGR